MSNALNVNKLKFRRTKITTIAIAMILILSMTASIVLLPSANAHTPAWTVPTSAYVTCAPGIVGVGQYTTIVCWLDRYSPTNGGENGQRWTGWQINITKPDGKTVIIGPWTCSSALASDYKVFTPDEVGTYTIVFSWPGGVVAPSIATASSVDTRRYFPRLPQATLQHLSYSKHQSPIGRNLRFQQTTGHSR